MCNFPFLFQVRIDHRTQSVHFGTDLTESQRTDLPEGPHVQAMPSEQVPFITGQQRFGAGSDPVGLKDPIRSEEDPDPIEQQANVSFFTANVTFKH